MSEGRLLPAWVLSTISATQEQDRMELGERAAIDLGYEECFGPAWVLEEVAMLMEDQ